MGGNDLETVEVMHFPFHRVTEEGAIRHILAALERGEGGWVLTPNLEILRMVNVDPALMAFFRQADLIVADGMPIVWASRLQNDVLPERVAGSSLVSTLTAAAAAAGRSVFLLGGDPGSAETAAAALVKRSPELDVRGTYCPPRGFEHDEAEMAKIRGMLGDAAADIVYVAVGCPKQERLIQAIRPDRPEAWYLGVGISFSYLSGDVQRAPAWMRKTGLEWFFRLAQEPGRLAKRYLVHDIPFAFRLGADAIRNRRR